MTDTMSTTELAELRSLIRRIDQLLVAPMPRAPVNANGTPGNVAAGELIESAWGNATADTFTRLSGVAAMGHTYSTANVQFFSGGSAADIGQFTAARSGRFLVIAGIYCFTQLAERSNANLDLWCRETNVHSPGVGVPVAVAQNIGIPIILLGFFDLTPGVYTIAVTGALAGGTNFWVGHRSMATLAVQPYNQA